MVFFNERRSEVCFAPQGPPNVRALYHRFFPVFAGHAGVEHAAVETIEVVDTML